MAMNFDVGVWLTRIKTFYESLSERKRWTLWISAGFFLLTVLLLSVLLMNPNYQVVFSNLDAKSAGQITQKLDQMKIPYQLQNNTILVPAAQADQVRVDMAMVGLPQSGYVDYSSILQQGNLFGMSTQELNLQVLNVLQDRIAQSLESIDGISSAQVNIVMPQQQTFIDPSTNQGAKASVLLTLGAGVTLSPGQVFGIQQLVAHAVPSLAATDVSVIDQYGNDLSSQISPQSALGQSSSSQAVQELSLRQQVESSLAGTLRDSLTKMLGQGNVSVIVHANMTFIDEALHQHVVTAGPPLSTQSSSSSSTGASSGTSGGIAGQATQNPNLSTYGSTGSGNGSSSLTRSSTTNYDNSYTDISKTLAPVQINGYTVSVVVNTSAVALTPPVMKEIRSYVQTAVGLTSVASPSVSVIGMPFAPNQGSGTTLGTGLNPAIGALGAVGLLLGMGGVTFGLVRRRNKKRLREDAIESISNAALASPPEEAEDATLANQLRELAMRRPEAFASLLRAWISEE